MFRNTTRDFVNFCGACSKFGIAATTVEPAGKTCLKLHADEAIGRMQWKMTH